MQIVRVQYYYHEKPSEQYFGDKMNRTLYVGKSDLDMPSWSPDGKKIAFVESGQLRVVDLDSSLLSSNASIFIYSKPEWLPKGDLVVVEGGDSDIYALSTTSEKSILVSKGRWPVLSKANNEIMFARGKGLFSTTLKGGKVKQLVDYCAGSGHYDWSSDGTKIVYSGKETNLMITNVKNGSSRTVFKLYELVHGLHVHFGNTPRWSPNGQFIAYHQVTDMNRIFVTEIDGSDFYVAGYGLAPSWSFDSMHLLFTTNSNEIKIGDPKSDREKIIGEGRAPCWSPNGTHVAFVEKQKNLVVIRV